MTTQLVSPTQPVQPGRRSFVRALAAGAVATFSGVLAYGSAQSVQEPVANAEDESVGVLIDMTRCTGCESCVLACKAANRMPAPETAGTALDCENLTCVQACQANCVSGAEETVFVKRQCMHCEHPACVAACTVGALHKSPAGPVVYDAGKCIGCRYCQYACPFGVPTYEWNNPLGLIVKCQLCMGRLQAGETPACTKACPNGALLFGKRQELLAQARARIASNPGQYVDHIYGEEEAGGTAMLYLSPAPFTELGFPTLHSEAPTVAAEAVMVRTPLVAVTVASLVTGAHFLFQRRAQVAAYHLHAHEGDAPAPEADPETEVKVDKEGDCA